MYGSNFQDHASVCSSIWGKIIKEVNVLKLHGVDLLAHCNLRVGSGHFTLFIGKNVANWVEVGVQIVSLCCPVLCTTRGEDVSTLVSFNVPWLRDNYGALNVAGGIFPAFLGCS
ncbi:hypothetical protein Tco_1320277 [Tanacetum coccineum]